MKRLMLALTAALTLSVTAGVSVANAWHYQVVTATAKCDTTKGIYNVTVTASSPGYANPYAENVNPSTIDGSTKGNVTVKGDIAWPGTSDTEPFSVTVTVDGSCTAPAPPPPPQCPSGYTQDAGSTSTALLCTKTVTNTVYGTPSCPSGTNQTAAGQGFVVCNTTNTVTNTVQAPPSTNTVYGSPTCPAGTTQTASGQGFVVCSTTNTVPGPARVTTKTVTQVKTVYGKPACPANTTKVKSGNGFVVCQLPTRTVVKYHVKPAKRIVVYGHPKCTGKHVVAIGHGKGSVTCMKILPLVKTGTSPQTAG